MNRPMFALELNPTKDTRYLVHNTESDLQMWVKNEVTGILVNLGEDDLQNLSSLKPGQSYFLSQARILLLQISTLLQRRITYSRRLPLSNKGVGITWSREIITVNSLLCFEWKCSYSLSTKLTNKQKFYMKIGILLDTLIIVCCEMLTLCQSL